MNQVFDLLPSSDVLRFTVAGGHATVVLRDDEALLFMVYVEHELRRLGQGSALLDQVTAWADDNDVTVQLAVAAQDDRPNNDELARWYGKHGWEQDGNGPYLLTRRPDNITRP